MSALCVCVCVCACCLLDAKTLYSNHPRYKLHGKGTGTSDRGHTAQATEDILHKRQRTCCTSDRGHTAQATEDILHKRQRTYCTSDRGHTAQATEGILHKRQRTYCTGATNLCEPAPSKEQRNTRRCASSHTQPHLHSLCAPSPALLEGCALGFGAWARPWLTPPE